MANMALINSIILLSLYLQILSRWVFPGFWTVSSSWTPSILLLSPSFRLNRPLPPNRSVPGALTAMHVGVPWLWLSFHLIGLQTSLSLRHKHRAWMLLKTLSLKDLSSVYIFSSVLTITCKTDPFARLMTPLPPSLPPLRVLQLGGRSVLSNPLYWIQQWAKLSFLYQSGSTKCLCLALMLCIHCVTRPQWHWTLEIVFALWFSAFYLSSCGLKRSTSSPEQRSDSGQCLLGLSFYY